MTLQDKVVNVHNKQLARILRAVSTPTAGGLSFLDEHVYRTLAADDCDRLRTLAAEGARQANMDDEVLDMPGPKLAYAELAAKLKDALEDLAEAKEDLRELKHEHDHAVKQRMQALELLQAAVASLNAPAPAGPAASAATTDPAAVDSVAGSPAAVGGAGAAAGPE